MFSRTNSGLSNFNTFVNVEYLIYSEGGSKDKNTSGNEEISWAIDCVFWRSVFEKFVPDRRIKIKPLGSKELVKPYAEKIKNNEISNSFAVLDRDYDPYRGELIDHPKILYTHGYSWENDACRPELLIALLGTYHPNGKLSEEDKVDIYERFSNFLKNINRAVYIDLLCGLCRIKGIDRKKFWKLVDETDPKNIKIKKDKLSLLISSIKSIRPEKLHYCGKERIAPEKDCYGKILSRFYYLIFCEYYKKITKAKNLPRENAEVEMAKAMKSTAFDDYPEVIKSHYEEKMYRIFDTA